MNQLRLILTGASGMVGEGVLLECLANPAVAAVLVLGRRPCGHTHPKMREILVPDLADLSAVETELGGYHACFFCAGISSVGISREAYERITQHLTLAVAHTLLRQNPDLAFCFVSGAGTDGTGTSRLHWARVKGQTENELRALPFRSAYAFRPGFLRATPGQHHLLKAYRYLGWLYPVLRRLAPGSTSTIREVGQAMIKATCAGYPKPVLEVRDIVALAAG